jgi:hypothetical protein
MKNRFPILLLLSLVPLAASAQTADEIVTKSLAARGGIEKIKTVQSQRISGTISFAPGAHGPSVIALKRPLKLHMEVTLEGKNWFVYTTANPRAGPSIRLLKIATHSRWLRKS